MDTRPDVDTRARVGRVTASASLLVVWAVHPRYGPHFIGAWPEGLVEFWPELYQDERTRAELRYVDMLPTCGACDGGGDLHTEAGLQECYECHGGGILEGEAPERYLEQWVQLPRPDPAEFPEPPSM